MTGPSRLFALVDCLNDLLFDLPRESFFARVAVNRGRRGCVMGVGGVDQDMVERDAGRLFDSPGRPVEHVAIDHQHVAGDERDLSAVLVLDDQGACPQLAFLAVGLAGADAAADHHANRRPPGSPRPRPLSSRPRPIADCKPATGSRASETS